MTSFLPTAASASNAAQAPHMANGQDDPVAATQMDSQQYTREFSYLHNSHITNITTVGVHWDRDYVSYRDLPPPPLLKY